MKCIPCAGGPIAQAIAGIGRSESVIGETVPRDQVLAADGLHVAPLSGHTERKHIFYYIHQPARPVTAARAA